MSEDRAATIIIWTVLFGVFVIGFAAGVAFAEVAR